MSKTIQVQYYAILREQRGTSHESVATDAVTAGDLYGSLSESYGFTLSPDQIRVAINAEFADWSTVLRDGDTVVYIPPVAGG